MVNRTFADRALKSAFGRQSVQVAVGASMTLVRFLWDASKAIAEESRRRFHAANQELKEAGKKPRKRLHHGPVFQAVREVLERPQKHLPQWMGEVRPPW